MSSVSKITFVISSTFTDINDSDNTIRVYTRFPTVSSVDIWRICRNNGFEIQDLFLATRAFLFSLLTFYYSQICMPCKSLANTVSLQLFLFALTQLCPALISQFSVSDYEFEDCGNCTSGADCSVRCVSTVEVHVSR